MYRIDRLLLLLAVFFSATASAAEYFGAPWHASSIPNPKEYPRDCNRGSEASTVCDPEAYLWGSEANEIEDFNYKIADEYKCEVGVLIISEMYKPSGASLATVTEIFARSVHDQWAIGNADTHRGILIFLSVLDRRIFISTGLGVQDRMTPQAIQHIINETRPFLRSKQYGSGLQHALNLVAKTLAGLEPEKHVKDNSVMITVLFIILIMVVIGLIIASKEQARRKAASRECRKKLTALETERAQALAEEYQIRSCPICLEDFDEPPVLEPEPQHVAGEALPEAEKVDGSANLRRRSRRKSTIGSHTHNIESKLPEDTTTPGNQQEERVSSASPSILLLRCGHKFHNHCISEWLEEHVSCPICRDDGEITEETDEGGRSRVVSAILPVAETVEYPVNRYGDEYAFRLRSLRRLYPQIITRRHVHTWERSMTAPLTADTSFIRSIRRYSGSRRHSTRGSTTSRSSSSGFRRRGWGGGRSGGGGGGGW